MRKAIDLGKQAFQQGEIPVGALVVSPNGQIIGLGKNEVEKLCDPTGHAEILAIREAAQNSFNYRLEGSILVCTLEPCAMCAGAIIHARLSGIVFGVNHPEQGAIVSRAEFFAAANLPNHIWYMGGVCGQECAQLLTEFFKQKRKILE